MSCFASGLVIFQDYQVSISWANLYHSWLSQPEAILSGTKAFPAAQLAWFEMPSSLLEYSACYRPLDYIPDIF